MTKAQPTGTRIAILRNPRACNGREEAGCPRIGRLLLAAEVGEEIEPGEDDQHGEAEETGSPVSNSILVSPQCALAA